MLLWNATESNHRWKFSQNSLRKDGVYKTLKKKKKSPLKVSSGNGRYFNKNVQKASFIGTQQVKLVAEIVKLNKTELK